MEKDRVVQTRPPLSKLAPTEAVATFLGTPHNGRKWKCDLSLCKNQEFASFIMEHASRYLNYDSQKIPWFFVQACYAVHVNKHPVDFVKVVQDWNKTNCKLGGRPPYQIPGHPSGVPVRNENALPPHKKMKYLDGDSRVHNVVTSPQAQQNSLLPSEQGKELPKTATEQGNTVEKQSTRSSEQGYAAEQPKMTPEQGKAADKPKEQPARNYEQGKALEQPKMAMQIQPNIPLNTIIAPVPLNFPARQGYIPQHMYVSQQVNVQKRRRLTVPVNPLKRKDAPNTTVTSSITPTTPNTTVTLNTTPSATLTPNTTTTPSTTVDVKLNSVNPIGTTTCNKCQKGTKLEAKFLEVNALRESAKVKELEAVAEEMERKYKEAEAKCTLVENKLLKTEKKCANVENMLLRSEEKCVQLESKISKLVTIGPNHHKLEDLRGQPLSSDKFDTSKKCPLCLHTFTSEGWYILGTCGHQYHMQCLVLHSFASATCLECKALIPLEFYKTIGLDDLPMPQAS